MTTNNNAELKVGTETADGVYAGLTADGSKQIYAMPEDIKTRFLKSQTMTFNKAAKRVGKLNADKAFGHDDWQIPELESLRALLVNQNNGKLKDTFQKVAPEIELSDWHSHDAPYSGGDDTNHPERYLSRTESPYPSCVWYVDFSDNRYESSADKSFGRYSCRPVRLVDVPHH